MQKVYGIARTNMFKQRVYLNLLSTCFRTSRNNVFPSILYLMSKGQLVNRPTILCFVGACASKTE